MNDDLIRAADWIDPDCGGEATDEELYALAARLRALAAGMGEPVGREGCRRPNVACAYPQCGDDCRHAPIYTAPQAAAPRGEAVADADFSCPRLGYFPKPAAPPANTLRDQMFRFVAPAV